MDLVKAGKLEMGSFIGISAVGLSLQAAFDITPGRTPENQTGPMFSLYLKVLSFSCSSSRLEVFSGYTSFILGFEICLHGKY